MGKFLSNFIKLFTVVDKRRDRETLQLLYTGLNVQITNSKA